MHGISYLNNAATSWPKPECVTDAVIESLTSPYLEGSRTSMRHFSDYAQLARQSMASLLGVKQGNIAFTSNATDALNMLIHGYAMAQKRPFHCLTSSIEHNSVLRPLYFLQRQGMIDLTIVEAKEPGYVCAQACEDALRDDTRLVVLSHGSNVMGTLQDIPAISRILPEDSFFMVDAAQTMGLRDVRPKDLGCDALVFTGHKYLFGLPGVGGFHISDPERVLATRQGGTGSLSSQKQHPSRMPQRFEAGTHNQPGLVSLWAASKYIKKTGPERMGKKATRLARMLAKKIRAEGVSLYNSRPDLPIVPFNVCGMDNEDVGYVLCARYGIIVRAGLHCSPLLHKKLTEPKGCVRLSPSYLNTRKDCDLAAEALHQIVEEARN